MELGNRALDYECEDNLVSHPNHYKSESGIEVIDVIDTFVADLQGIFAAYTSNVIKYVLRYPKKNGVQDLKKAQWYLTRMRNKASEPYGKLVVLPKESIDNIAEVVKNFSTGTFHEHVITSMLSWCVTGNTAYLQMAQKYLNILIKQVEKENK